MILRRLTQHIKAQNWFAVGLDFLIVVVGVFMGLQVSNWNESRKNADDYQLALDRLEEEAKSNLSTLENIEASLDGRLAAATAAFDILLSCNTQAQNDTLINAGLLAIRGTVGLKIQHRALDEMTQSKDLLSQQSITLRKDLTDISARIELLESEARFAENLPLAQSMQNNPILTIGPRISENDKMVSSEFPIPRRNFSVAVPFSQACQDNTLLKSFYTWEIWQSRQRALTYDMRQQVESLIKIVGAK
jgi:hypothetical protein